MTDTTNAQAPAPSKPVDLSTLDIVKDANGGAEIQLFHPTKGTDLGVFIDLVGRDSDEFRDTQRDQNRRRLQGAKKGGIAAAVQMSERLEEDGVELLAACTRGWRGLVVDGKDVPFSFDNAVAVYTRFPWIKEQVDVAVGDRSLFIKG